jgi:hypothetical protein
MKNDAFRGTPKALSLPEVYLSILVPVQSKPFMRNESNREVQCVVVQESELDIIVYYLSRDKEKGEDRNHSDH